jgi:hypothetical protein
VGGAALATAGCGGSTPSPRAMQLERADLVAVTRALAKAQPSVSSEVAATKAAWHLVVNGLPADTSAIPRRAIRAASERAAEVGVPALFEERQAAALTGPGSGIAGLFRWASILAARGWRQIDAAIEQTQHGSPAGAHFARANVDLYIECVYDANFGLAQIGKKLLSGYKKVGGPSAFGSTLTQAEVAALADAFSEANDRLHPHTGVRLGS